MKSFSFFASGLPKGQPRPRAFVRNFGGKPVARVYDAGTAEGWKSQIADAAKPYVTGEPINGPVKITVTFYFPRPKSHFSKGGILKEGMPVYHTSKPDVDNCMKAVLDAITQLGLWRDDKQVCVQKGIKMYARATPGALIEITELAP